MNRQTLLSEFRGGFIGSNPWVCACRGHGLSVWQLSDFGDLIGVLAEGHGCKRVVRGQSRTATMTKGRGQTRR